MWLKWYLLRIKYSRLLLKWLFCRTETVRMANCFTLQWRDHEGNCVSNHRRHHYLLNRLFRRRSKKTPKLRVTGLCERNSPVTGEFPAQRASNAENVSIWWRHHEHPVLYVWRTQTWSSPCLHRTLLGHQQIQRWLQIIKSKDRIYREYTKSMGSHIKSYSKGENKPNSNSQVVYINNHYHNLFT